MAKKSNNNADKVWGITRITLGFVFFWAFLDKLIGLGYATCRDVASGAVDIMCDKAWLSGGSPTTGFLKFGTDGPLASFYQGLAGNVFIDWLFMLGMAGIGLALILGIGMRVASISGVLMMSMMYTAALWPANNPLIDEHVVYALVLVGLYLVNDDQKYGFGAKWKQSNLVKRFPVLG